MRVTDVVEEEKLAVFHQAAFRIAKDCLQEDVFIGAKKSLLGNQDESDIKTKLVNIFCDGYVWGMSTALALIEAGIIDMQTLEIQTKAKEE